MAASAKELQAFAAVLKVSAFNKVSSSTETWSEAVTTTSRTFQLPNAIQLVNSTSDSLTVSWTSPSDDSVQRHRLEYRQVTAAHGRLYVGAEGGTCPPPPPTQIHLLPPLQIQKLTDRSDVISEVPKCSKIQIFRAPPRTPLGELIVLS